MHTLAASLLALAASFSLFAARPAHAAEGPTFAAVHLVGDVSWVELERFEDEPTGGRTVTLSDDFFHAVRKAIPGARALGTPVRIFEATGGCDGTLGRPAILGVYYSDEGFGGGPVWIRAAPVRGCGDAGGTVAVLSPAAHAAVAREATSDGTPAVTLAAARARVALTTSAPWLAARADWAASFPEEAVTTHDRVFALGADLWALADDGVSAECGTQLDARTFVHRAPDGTMTSVPFPGSDSETLSLLGDLDGDGQLEALLAGGGGGLRLVRLGAGDAAALWSNDGIPFFGCPC